ncbi:Tat pathway signal sequence [Faecalibacterium prausnitzii]|uniref:Tat pathway signal sequence n=1 Tax=Faecalibacterium prausnitzii TaxID=853 RepID=A0A2A7B5U2_9FIRM|nr:ABC transporter substrate-binding protein [Faecalibacterium prausnitzii]PDX86773.1 Tat pathway signal sequence [Faecalibacterium prausnitzii]
MSINFESHKLDRRSFLKGAGMVGAASLLAACGGKSDNGSSAASTSGAAAPNTTGATPLKEFISFESGNRELESWNMLYTQQSSDANVITNLWDGLLSFDCYGKVVPAIASSWEHNDDSTVWTFHLRDDVDWVDANGEVKDHLTSKDFLVGFEWVMNSYKNEANNTSMPNDTVVGAADYYEQTKAAGDAAADMTYEDMLAAGVGIEAPDDYTLVFTCKDPCPYFDTVAAYNSFYPVAPALLDELGIEGFRGCDNTTMWYNGPYVVEEYIQGNTKSYIPNPSYYDAANVSRFERLTITMISDGSISLQLYENRELDEVDLGESSIATIQADPSNVFNQQLCEKRPKKFSYCFIFNYDKRKADGTADENWNKAIANKAFRQCFSKGLELSKFYARYNPINPLKCENDFFTMSGLCYTTDGTDYTSLVAKELGLDGEKYDGKTMKRLRTNNGDITDLKKQAMDELSAIGVTFPVHCSYYILAGSTTALDSATVLKQCFTDSFGDDFIVLDIETFVSSTMKEVVAPKLQSFVHMGWGADFGDPINFLTQIVVHDDNAYYSCNMTNIEGIAENGAADYQKDLVAAYEQFTDLVNEGRAIVNDTDARYAAFAKAEAYFLEENLIFPTVYDVTWCLTHANEYSKINAMYGPCNYKAVNWETSEEAYTTEQYEEFAAAFDAATQA